MLFALIQAAPQGPLEAALGLERSGEPREAIAALGAIAVDPGSPMAGRVLYERARLTDEWLDDPLGAAHLYDGYLTAFPTGPYARSARDRRDYLVKNSAGAPAALAEFQDLLRDFPRLPAEVAVARMEALVQRYPSFPLRPRACFWLASVLRQRREFGRAERWLGLVVSDYPGTTDARRAELAIADIEAGQQRFGAALAVYHKYEDSADPLARELARSQLGFTLAARAYLWLYRGGLAFLALLTGGLLLGIRRRKARLRPWPWEARLFFPIAGLLAALTVFEDRKVGLAVVAIALGGGLLLVLQGAYLRVASPRGLRRILQLAASAVAAASLAYCAVYRVNLTALVVTTIEQGADR